MTPRACMVCGWHYTAPSSEGLCPACREEHQLSPEPEAFMLSALGRSVFPLPIGRPVASPSHEDHPERNVS